MPHLFNDRSFIVARWTIALTLFVMAACIAGCSRSAPTEPAPVTTPEPPHTARKVEFVVFSAEWCVACREIPQVLEWLRGVFPAITFRELNIDEKENETLWVAYGSDAIPFNYILAEGKVIAKFRGFLPPAEAEKFVRETLKSLETPGE